MGGQKRLALRTASLTMAFKPCVTLALLMGIAAVTRGEECSGGECGSEEIALLALRSVEDRSTHNSSSDEASRRRKPPVHCRNNDGTKFSCAGGDRCCGGACVGEGDICCENVNGDGFPCQGKGGQCCGNACAAPGSKCCKPKGPKSGWYPVSKGTQCRAESVKCRNRAGNGFECANGDQCCGDICVSEGDVCCENVNGNNFACQGHGGGCCGNACYAPGSKCCQSWWVPKARWYPVTKATACAF